MRPIALLVAALLLAVPAVEALEIATKSAKVRPSEEYSPKTAWDLGYYGCGVTVAIFDNGVDDKHPWLDGKVAAGVDTSDTSTFWTQANGGNPQPLQGSHGTPVAGIVMSHAGKPMTKPGDVPNWDDDDRVGVAPCAWMVDVQFQDVGQPQVGTVCAGTCFEERVVNAFDWAIANIDNDWGDNDPLNDGIDIITMSWSPNDETDGTDAICMAANKAVAAGIVVLGSAGNSGGVEAPDLGCPTGADGAISVANVCDGHESDPTTRTVTRDDDVICTHSTWGPRTDDGDDDLHEELKPDIASLGQGIYSTDDARLDGREYTLAGCGEDSIHPDPLPYFGSCDTRFGGTSAATPFTAGVVALMLEANGNLTPADVKEILHQIAVPWPDQEPSAPELNAKWHYHMAYGMMDAYAAVQAALTWPGMDLGKDTDSDGIRDYRDASPLDPRDARTVAPRITTPAGGALDSDGDGILDQDDPQPLIPGGTDAAPDNSEESPAVGVIALIAMLAMVLVRRP